MANGSPNMGTFCWHCLQERPCPMGSECGYINCIMPDGVGMVKKTEMRKFYLSVRKLCMKTGDDSIININTKELPGWNITYEDMTEDDLPRYPDERDNHPRRGWTTRWIILLIFFVWRSSLSYNVSLS